MKPTNQAMSALVVFHECSLCDYTVIIIMPLTAIRVIGNLKMTVGELLRSNVITFAILGGLTHWGRVTHICGGNLTIIGPDNGLSPDRHQAIIWTNAGILSIGPLGTKLSEILIAIHILSFKKMHLKMSSAKRRPFCLGLNELTVNRHTYMRRCHGLS